MLRLRSYGLAVAGAILAMLPCSPVFLLGLPIGIWALVTLRRQEVIDAFAARPTEPQGLALTSAHTPTSLVTPAEPIRLEAVQRRLRAPAGGLLITGLVTVLFALTAILWSGWQLARHASAPTEPQKSTQGGLTNTMTPNKDAQAQSVMLVPLLVSQIAALVCGMLTLLAVLAMRKVEHYGLALLGSGAALIPISHGWIIGFPLGLWSLLVLRRRGVKETFDRPMTAEEETLPDAAQQTAWLREWFGSAAGWAMLVAFLGAATTFLPWVRITIFGITTTMAGFDRWHGIVSGCTFVGAFLALVAISYIKPIGLLRALAMAAGGVTALVCVWIFLAEMAKPQEVSKPTGTGSPEMMNAFADLFKDMFTSGIQATVLSGPYVTLGFGIVLLILCAWQMGEVVVGGWRSKAIAQQPPPELVG
jgi:uncharacterized membrane protein